MVSKSLNDHPNLQNIKKSGKNPEFYHLEMIQNTQDTCLNRKQDSRIIKIRKIYRQTYFKAQLPILILQSSCVVFFVFFNFILRNAIPYQTRKFDFE